MLITLIGLAIMLLPVLGVLRRVANSLQEVQRLRFLAKALSAVLMFVLPKDASWTSLYVQNGTLWIGFPWAPCWRRPAANT